MNKLISISILMFFLSSCSSVTGLFTGGDKFFYKNGYENVKLNTENKNIKNLHPINISEERIQGALRLLLVKRKRKSMPLLSEQKMKFLATGISDALAEAKQNQDVIFTIENWYKERYISVNKVTSARVFYNKSGLNIIFGSILRKGNMSETDPMVSAGVNPDFNKNPLLPGSRYKSIKSNSYLSAPPNTGVFRPRVAKGRLDWLVFTKKALQNRGILSSSEKKLAQQSNIQVQSLSDEVSKLRNELKNIQNNQYPRQNYGYPPPNYGYGYPPPNYGYGYPPQNYGNSYPPRQKRQYQDYGRQNTSQKSQFNSTSYANSIKEIQNLRKRGLISKEEYESRIRDLKSN